MQLGIAQNAADLFIDIYVSAGNAVYYFYEGYSRQILDMFHVIFDHSFRGLLFMMAILAFVYLLVAIVLLLRRKRVSVPVRAGKEPTVTIQIPTYNELAAINCAKRCVDFDYPKEKMQIIIGDDSSDPAVSAEIGSFAAKHPALVKITRRAKNTGFKPGNLNNMLKSSSGDIIVIFDSDFLPDRDFLKRIVAPFSADQNLSVVQARWKISNFSQNIFSVLGGTISLICHSITLEFIRLFRGNGFLCGSAEAIRRKHLIEVGGWTDGCLTEDIECSLRLIANGRKLFYLEGLECECEAPHRFSDLCKQQMRWAYGVIASLKSHAGRIILSKKARLIDKISVFFFASGYLFSFLLLLVTLTGILSVISQRPAPIDWVMFMSQTGFNLALTSGFLLSSMLVLSRTRKAGELPRMVWGSLTIGLAVTFYVNLGIMKAWLDRDMRWYMLDKNGNRDLQ